MELITGLDEALDRYKEDGQSFVVRLRDNVPQCRSKNHHIFQDFEGREIRVATDLMQVTAEQIVEMYKARWQIEVFFRWIKQHLNIHTLSGTTENAVYGLLKRKRQIAPTLSFRLGLSS